MLWTDTLSDKIAVLWRTQSSREIAATLGIEDHIDVTRNAVIGRLHRMKLTIEDKIIVHRINCTPRTQEQKIALRIARNKRYELKRQARLENRIPIEEVEFRRKRAARESQDHRIAMAAREDDLGEHNVHGIEGLAPHHCRFPLNADMSKPIWCGRQKGEGSYCHYHQFICRGVGTSAEQRASS